jgi:hypothetical protein
VIHLTRSLNYSLREVGGGEMVLSFFPTSYC